MTLDAASIRRAVILVSVISAVYRRPCDVTHSTWQSEAASSPILVRAHSCAPIDGPPHRTHALSSEDRYILNQIRAGVLISRKINCLGLCRMRLNT